MPILYTWLQKHWGLESTPLFASSLQKLLYCRAHCSKPLLQLSVLVVLLLRSCFRPSTSSIFMLKLVPWVLNAFRVRFALWLRWPCSSFIQAPQCFQPLVILFNPRSFHPWRWTWSRSFRASSTWFLTYKIAFWAWDFSVHQRRGSLVHRRLLPHRIRALLWIFLFILKYITGSSFLMATFLVVPSHSANEEGFPRPGQRLLIFFDGQPHSFRRSRVRWRSL